MSMEKRTRCFSDCRPVRCPAASRHLVPLLPVLLFLLVHPASCLPDERGGGAGSGVFEQDFHGARWGASRSSLLTTGAASGCLRGEVFRERSSVPPDELPYIRETGPLYFMQAARFSSVSSRLRVRGAGEIVTDYFFLDDRLFLVRQIWKGDFSFQDLSAYIGSSYGGCTKEVSSCDDGTRLVSLRWKGVNTSLELDYSPSRVEGGWICERMELLVKYIPVLREIEAYHDELRKKYGK